MSRETPSVGVYSPLHSVFERFVERLVGLLDGAGIGHHRLTSRNGEVGRDHMEKARVLGAHMRNVHRHVRGDGPTVVAWPLLGWWEMPLWRSPMHATFVTMHDPEPLLAQNGLTPTAARWASRIAGSRGPHVVTLSPEARDIVVRYFDPERIHLLPHPMRAPRPVATEGHRRPVLVLGQYEPARDLDVMASMGRSWHGRGGNPPSPGAAGRLFRAGA